MSRTKRSHLILIKSQREEFRRKYRRYKTGGPPSDVYYQCASRKGRPGFLNDDGGWSEDTKSLYEYLIGHEDEAV